MIVNRLFFPPAITLFIFSTVHPSPVIFPLIINSDSATIPKDFCILTPNFGYQGSIKFVEECNSLDVFPTLPIPGPLTQKFGTHPMVCCPKLSSNNICFPTDTWCPSYIKPTTTAAPKQEELTDYIDEGFDIVTEAPIFVKSNVPKISDEDCSVFVPFWGNTTKCVNFKDCPGIFSLPFNPSPTKNPAYAGVCGWDNEDKATKVCCPGTLIQEKTLRKEIEPRFPGYQCHDKVKQCKRWKNNNGCRTDMDFIIDPEYPDNGRANSGVMFDFMMSTCMETCGQCGDKGCRDEHPDCVDWARQGFCVTKSDFLAHTCRESCGVCGFLSTDDSTEQVVGENTYTDFRNSKFDCGRYKLLSEINPKKEEEQLSVIKPKEEEDYDIRSTDEDSSKLRKKRQNSEDEDVDVFFSTVSGTFFCGATLISDRWIVSASHCYDDFASSVGQVRQVKTHTMRDKTPYKEIIEIKRIYKHPKYEYPHLYNDVALLELGRRVDYNWDKYGDTPTCIDILGENDGKIATIQGYGTTEDGTLSSEPLETNVTVISNTQCKKTLDFNATSSKPIIKTKIKQALPEGLNDKMFCARGTETSEGFIRGACVGDSGGPLFVRKDDGRQMLVGIVSGGIGCGQGYPGWYTKVAFFTSWIECIIDNSKIYKNNKARVEKECNELAEKAEEATPDDYIFAGDLRGADDDDASDNFLYDDDDAGDYLDYGDRG